MQTLKEMANAINRVKQFLINFPVEIPSKITKLLQRRKISSLQPQSATSLSSIDQSSHQFPIVGVNPEVLYPPSGQNNLVPNILESERAAPINNQMSSVNHNELLRRNQRISNQISISSASSNTSIAASNTNVQEEILQQKQIKSLESNYIKDQYEISNIDQSKLGLCCSTTTITMTIVFLIMTLCNTNILSNSQNNRIPFNTTYQIQNFMLILYFDSYNSSFIQRILHLELKNEGKKTNTTALGYSFVDCQQLERYQELFKNQNLTQNTFLCLDMRNQNATFTAGELINTNFQFLHLIISKCKNSSNFYDDSSHCCLPQDQIDKTLGGNISFKVLFKNYILHPDTNNPTESYLDTSNQFIIDDVNGFTKVFELQSYQILTPFVLSKIIPGAILSTFNIQRSYSKEKIFKLSDKIQSNSFQIREGKPISQISLKLMQVETTITKQYQSFFDALASNSSIVMMLTSIVGIFASLQAENEIHYRKGHTMMVRDLRLESFPHLDLKYPLFFKCYTPEQNNYIEMAKKYSEDSITEEIRLDPSSQELKALKEKYQNFQKIIQKRIPIKKKDEEQKKLKSEGEDKIRQLIIIYQIDGNDKNGQKAKKANGKLHISDIE